jgi:hypothetical protein
VTRLCAPPTSKASSGYQFLRLESASLSKGWYVDLGWSQKRRLAIVAQVAGSYKPAITFAVPRSITFTESEKVYEFLLGVRVRGRASPAFVPFGQVLVGNGLTSSSASVSGGGTPFSSTHSYFALLLLGGGVNIEVTNRIGIRVGADYGLGFAQGEGEGVFRLGLGLNIPF